MHWHEFDELCKSVPIEGTMIAKGIPDEGYEHKKDMGTAITVRLDHAPVSVVILNDAIQFYEPEQYTRCGIVLKEYDVVVVKQGYISAEFAAYGDLCMMALTQGPTYQRSELLKFKQIYRPMWPYDDYDLEDML